MRLYKNYILFIREMSKIYKKKIGSKKMKKYLPNGSLYNHNIR